MKAISILALALVAGVSASAQKSLVKEVERDLKSTPENYPSLIQKLTPAFTNDETAQDVRTYLVAGNGAYAFYDKQSVFAQMGKDVDKKQLGNSVLEGFDYLWKALPLDSVPDAKGKVKAKNSAKIYKTIASHYNDFLQAAGFLWETQDYKDAVKCWEKYVTLKDNPQIVKAGINVPADTLVAEIKYNMGIGASLAQDPEASLAYFQDAIASGYNKKNVFDYAISCASQLKRPEVMAAIAEQAYPLYGAEDSRYIGYMVNNLIDKKQFAEADALIDKYIAADPNNAQLYFVKGVLLDSEQKPAESLAAFQKSIALDENNAAALFQLGYKLYEKACDMDQNETAGMSQQDYKTFRAEKVDPMLRESSTYLEKAFKIDENMSEARQVLRSIYYNLNDEENLKRVESM